MGYKGYFLDNVLYGAEDINKIRKSIMSSGVILDASASCAVTKQGGKVVINAGAAVFPNGCMMEIDTDGISFDVTDGLKYYVYLEYDDVSGRPFGRCTTDDPPSGAVKLAEIETTGVVADVRQGCKLKTPWADQNAAGLVQWYAGSTPPTGWLECNGNAVSRTTYAALFSAIGTTYGAGDGSTTFHLPDLRGEFVRGWDHGRGADSGREFGSYQQGTKFAAGTDDPDMARILDGGEAAGTIRGSYSGSSSGSGTTQTAMTHPRNVALLPIIKY